jgi:hypothetical protein
MFVSMNRFYHCSWLEKFIQIIKFAWVVPNFLATIFFWFYEKQLLILTRF